MLKITLLESYFEPGSLQIMSGWLPKPLCAWGCVTVQDDRLPTAWGRGEHRGPFNLVLPLRAKYCETTSAFNNCVCDIRSREVTGLSVIPVTEQ